MVRGQDRPIAWSHNEALRWGQCAVGGFSTNSCQRLLARACSLKLRRASHAGEAEGLILERPSGLACAAAEPQARTGLYTVNMIKPERLNCPEL